MRCSVILVCITLGLSSATDAEDSLYVRVVNVGPGL